MEYIDIRSDTVTRPSRAMLETMLEAKVGDDVFGEDPTVNLLQEKCAEITGKEKALFVPTGCMANQLAVKSHTMQGDEIILERESHILNYETSAAAIISNAQLYPIAGINGVMDPEDIKKSIRSTDYFFPRTRLICIENTHNRAGGVIQPFDNLKSISNLARENGIRMHMDGARIFNASVETGISVKQYASLVDSISFCFSKGLGAPVGSIICGSSEFIEIAHKWRKILGGGMRQSGVLAAAALYALEHNVDRLKEDHAKAKYFANEINKIDGIEVDLDTVQTNMVIFESKKYEKSQYINLLKDKGVLVSAGSFQKLRAVFHLDVQMCDVSQTVEIIKEL